MFSHYGYLFTLISYNGPQFSLAEMKEFTESLWILDSYHYMSPYYPQVNGQAECKVLTMTDLLRNAKDPHMTLLTYCAMPLELCGLIPA